jgi:hypothetical protein
MLVCIEAVHVQTGYNILAALSAWLTLAGFVVFPNTFTSLKASNTLGESEGGKLVQRAIQNISLLWVAGIFCVIGILGTLLVSFKCKNNLWRIQQLFS